MSRAKYILVLVCSIFLIVFGLAITLGALIGLKDSDNVLGDLFALAGMGVSPIALGSWLFFWNQRQLRAAREERIEQEILELAAANGGKLTPSTVALHTKLGLHEAQQRLLRMQEKGFTVLHTSSEGAIVFHFYELG